MGLEDCTSGLALAVLVLKRATESVGLVPTTAPMLAETLGILVLLEGVDEVGGLVGGDGMEGIVRNAW